MAKIKVLIADDHAIVREGIRMILASHEDIEVVGEAADGRETISPVDKLTRAVAQGKSFIAPAIADKVIKGYLERPEAGSDDTLYDRLSDREKTVFKLIA